MEALDSPAVYGALMEGTEVEGLLDLPVDSILSAIPDAYPTALRAPNGPDSEWIDWVSDDGSSSFQVEWSRLHVLVECRHLDNESKNRIIDVLDRFECPLYDPQITERFDSHTEN